MQRRIIGRSKLVYAIQFKDENEYKTFEGKCVLATFLIDNPITPFVNRIVLFDIIIASIDNQIEKIVNFIVSIDNRIDLVDNHIVPIVNLIVSINNQIDKQVYRIVNWIKVIAFKLRNGTIICCFIRNFSK